jgi:hypothetical protein
MSELKRTPFLSISTKEVKGSGATKVQLEQAPSSMLKKVVEILFSEEDLPFTVALEAYRDGMKRQMSAINIRKLVMDASKISVVQELLHIMESIWLKQRMMDLNDEDSVYFKKLVAFFNEEAYEVLRFLHSFFESELSQNIKSLCSDLMYCVLKGTIQDPEKKLMPALEQLLPGCRQEWEWRMA